MYLFKVLFRSVSGVSDVSKSAKYFKWYSFLEWLKPFVQRRKPKSTVPHRTDDLEANGHDHDENGPNYNLDFGEDQDGEGEFSMSCMVNKRIFLTEIKSLVKTKGI